MKIGLPVSELLISNEPKISRLDVKERQNSKVFTAVAVSMREYTFTRLLLHFIVHSSLLQSHKCIESSILTCGNIT
jgi:hypothetical protein